MVWRCRSPLEFEIYMTPILGKIILYHPPKEKKNLNFSKRIVRVFFSLPYHFFNGKNGLEIRIQRVNVHTDLLKVQLTFLYDPVVLI